jgi:uncharacterized membrane protein
MKTFRNKLLLLALLVSVGINLFLVGGIVYRTAFHSEFGPRPLPRNVSWIIRDLSEARQQELQPLLESSRQESETLRREMFMAQRRVNGLMANSNFNTEELNSAFAALRTASMEYQAVSHRQTVEILGRLTLAERAQAQEFLQRRGPQGSRSERGQSSSRTPGLRPDGELRNRPPANNGVN